MKVVQLQFPLFPPDMMEKVKEGHRLREMARMEAEIEHLKHQRDGYHGAYERLKQITQKNEKEFKTGSEGNSPS